MNREVNFPSEGILIAEGGRVRKVHIKCMHTGTNILYTVVNMLLFSLLPYNSETFTTANIYFTYESKKKIV